MDLEPIIKSWTFTNLTVDTTDIKKHLRKYLTHDNVNIANLPKIILNGELFIYQNVKPTLNNYAKYCSPIMCVRSGGKLVMLVRSGDSRMRSHLEKINAIINNKYHKLLYNHIVDVKGIKITTNLIKLKLWGKTGTFMGVLYITVDIHYFTQKISIRYYCKSNNYYCPKFIMGIMTQV